MCLIGENSLQEVQKVYGLKESVEQAQRVATGEQESDANELCILCFDKRIDTMIKPCNHMILCQGCTKDLGEKSMVCPKCRTRIESLVSLKLV